MASISNELFCKDLPTKPRSDIGKILVTGANGYIGGRLVPELLYRGYKVRIMVRKNSPEYLKRWPGIEIAEADALDIINLSTALKGIHTAYYLIHSLRLGQKNFEKTDLQAAANFRNAAEKQGVKRI
ncbi:MAG: NAD(P)H-binding protein, partial [Bacteroidales bacterium]|nr:NAD(P)H-binding protein [Bacteroidales bacterium]